MSRRCAQGFGAGGGGGDRGTTGRLHGGLVHSQPWLMGPWSTAAAVGSGARGGPALCPGCLAGRCWRPHQARDCLEVCSAAKQEGRQAGSGARAGQGARLGDGEPLCIVSGLWKVVTAWVAASLLVANHHGCMCGSSASASAWAVQPFRLSHICLSTSYACRNCHASRS